MIDPLLSPQSLLAEGTANFGIDVAFPGAERSPSNATCSTRWPGSDPATADRYATFRIWSSA
jgi:hypothetical protein